MAVQFLVDRHASEHPQLSMTVPRQRSSSPTSAPPPQAKRLKTAHATGQDTDTASHFASGLLDEQTAHHLKASYEHSRPFKHALVEKLFQDELLTKVKDECLSELSFTEKETDIYKVSPLLYCTHIYTFMATSRSRCTKRETSLPSPTSRRPRSPA